MAIHDTGMFTMKEINRLKILQDVIDRNLRPGQAAEMLGITPRHCSRLLKRYRQSGPLGMNNKSRGRPGNRLLPTSLTNQVLNIIRERYSDFGPTLAQEKLAENHGIVLELNIQTICANTSSAKGRVERAHLTLQDRLVKEFRLRSISSVDAANDYADEFMADYNRRFAKAPRHDFDVHRPLEIDDDLTAFFTWREPRRVSKSLTVQYDKVLYLIEDNELSRRAIGKYIEVWHYPDGRKELRLNGAALPYSTYDRLSEIDQGAIVDNKRLGRTLEFIKLVQDKRDNNRSQAIPAGDGPSRRRRKPTEKKSQRSLNGDDMLDALKTLQSRSGEIFGKSK